MKRTMKLGTVAAVMAMVLVQRSGEALEVANPTVSAAVSGGHHGQPFGGFAAADVPAGYIEEERFISGTAASYAAPSSCQRRQACRAKAPEPTPANVHAEVASCFHP